MIFLKTRKLRRSLINPNNASLIFKAMDLNNVEYALEKIHKRANLAMQAEVVAQLNSWDSNKCLVTWVSASDHPDLRIIMVIKDITAEKLIDMTNKVISLKAFL